MKIVLLNPPHKFKYCRASRWPESTKSGTLYYPYWLAYATGVLMETEHEPILIDAIAKEWGFQKTIDEVVKLSPDLVVIDTSTPSITNDVKFIEQFKEFSETKLILVGTHPTVLPEQTLSMSESIDFIARKEYEYTIPDLANTLENNGNLKNVLGIYFKKDKKIVRNPDRPLIKDLDALPFVSKVYKKFLNVYDYRYAQLRHPMIQVVSSRSCPCMCTFCNVPLRFLSHELRIRSVENFVDELEWIVENIPEIKEIFIEDDTFTINKKRVVEVCNSMIERNLKIIWSTNARADIPYDVLQKMKYAGCRMVIVGYESGVQRILNNVKKGVTIKQAEEFTKNAKRAGIKVFGSFMIGLPGDTKETIEQTLKFAKKLDPDTIQIQQAVPFPETEFYEWCQKNGYLLTNDFSKWLDENGQLNFIVSYPNLSAEELKRMRDKLMINFYTSPRHIASTIVNNLNPFEIKRLTKASFTYLSFLLRRRLANL